MSDPIRNTADYVPDAARFRETLVEHLRESLAGSGAVLGIHTQRRREGLMHGLIEEVRSFDDSDLRLRDLYLMQLQRDAGFHGGERAFRPGPQQSRLIAQIGPAPAEPRGSDLLAELQTAGTEDLIAGLQEQHRGHVHKQVEELRMAADERMQKAVTEAQDREDTEAAARVTAEARVAELTRERNYLLSLTNLDQSDIPANGEPADRYKRKHFDEDPPGVSRTKGANGSLKFEVKVGRNPWRSFTDRDKAIRHAESLRAKDEKPADDDDPIPEGQTVGSLSAAEAAEMGLV